MNILENILILRLNKVFNTNCIDIKGDRIKNVYIGNLKTNILFCSKIEDLVWKFRTQTVESVLNFYVNQILTLINRS